jgi:predicted membrane chloride channel (bestrophin family)
MIYDGFLEANKLLGRLLADPKKINRQVTHNRNQKQI